MGDLVRNLQHEVSRLKDENQILRDETASLKGYVGAIESLMDAIDELDPTSEILPLLDRILYNAMVVTTSKDGSLMVLDEESQELAFVHARGDITIEKLAGQRLPLGKGIAGWVAQNGKPAIVDNARTDTRFFPGIDDAYRFTTNSVLAVPIIGQGQVLGVIEVLNKLNGKPYGQADQMLLSLLCRFAGDVLWAMARQEEKPVT
jgi:GAF domain-containing protein